MKKVEDSFHTFVQKRIVDTAEYRKKKGLRVIENNDEVSVQKVIS